MPKLHRTRTHRYTHLAELVPANDSLRERLAAIGARTETCKHGYDYRSICNIGCDDQPRKAGA